jgi:Ca2+-binding RTX toxin-like protein
VDTIVSHTRSWVLSANVENLVLKGSFAQRGTGNELANRLISNDAGSTLDGGGGNDVLVAGRGADILTGGSGADVFVFATAPAQAGRVTDFQAGVDMLDLRGLFAQARYGGSDPLADGLLRLAHDGAGGTAVWFDADGSGAGSAVRVTTLEACRPGALHLQADVWFA